MKAGKSVYRSKSRKAGPAKGNKHSGIYGQTKDITPCPQKVYMSMTWNIPVPLANALQEKYPDQSLAACIKKYITSSLTPIESNEIS